MDVHHKLIPIKVQKLYLHIKTLIIITFISHILSPKDYIGCIKVISVHLWGALGLEEKAARFVGCLGIDLVSIFFFFFDKSMDTLKQL